MHGSNVVEATNGIHDRRPGMCAAMTKPIVLHMHATQAPVVVNNGDADHLELVYSVPHSEVCPNQPPPPPPPPHPPLLFPDVVHFLLIF